MVGLLPKGHWMAEWIRKDGLYIITILLALCAIVYLYNSEAEGVKECNAYWMGKWYAQNNHDIIGDIVCTIDNSTMDKYCCSGNLCWAENGGQMLDEESLTAPYIFLPEHLIANPLYINGTVWE